MPKVRCDFQPGTYLSPVAALHKLFDVWNTGSGVVGVTGFSANGGIPPGLTKEAYGLRYVAPDGHVIRIHGYVQTIATPLVEEVGGAPVNAPAADNGTYIFTFISLHIRDDGVVYVVNVPSHGLNSSLALPFPASARHNGVDTSRVAILWRTGVNGNWNVANGKGYLQNGLSTIAAGPVFGLIYPVWSAGVTGTFDPATGEFVKVSRAMGVYDLYGDTYQGSLKPVIWPALLGADDFFTDDGIRWNVEVAYGSTNDTLLVAE